MCCVFVIILTCVTQYYWFFEITNEGLWQYFSWCNEFRAEESIPSGRLVTTNSFAIYYSRKLFTSLPPKMRKTSCSPPHPTAIINVSSAARPCINLGKTTWDGAVWKGSIFIPQNVENIYFLSFSVFVIIADLSLIPRLKDEHKQNGLFVCFKEGTDMLTQYSFLTHGPLGQH